jgi:hypothetical protein
MVAYASKWPGGSFSSARDNRALLSQISRTTCSSSAASEQRPARDIPSETGESPRSRSAEVPVLSSRLVQETVLRYRIDYSPEAEDHLEALTPRLGSVVLDAVERQLTHQPSAVVIVKAVGIKVRNTVRIGNEEVKL